MPVSKSTADALKRRMDSLGIYEGDLIEKFILGSGSGGQKVQKTHSCVYLKHEPTGIEVKCQKDRQREMNRFFARREICDKLDEQINKEKSKRQQAIEKIRRQKRKRSKRAKNKMLDDKKKHGDTKRMRQPPSDNNGN